MRLESACLLWFAFMSSGTENGNEQTPPSAVDARLIDEMPALRPEERLRHNDRMVRTIEMLRQGLSEMTRQNGC
jgi:hypothetical protein